MSDLEFSGVVIESIGDMTRNQWANATVHIVILDTKLETEVLIAIEVPIAYIESDTIGEIRNRIYLRTLESLQVAVIGMDTLPTPPLVKSEGVLFPEPSGPVSFDLQFRVARFFLFEDMRLSGWANAGLQILLVDKKLNAEVSLDVDVPIEYDGADTTRAIRTRAFRRALECCRLAMNEIEASPLPRVGEHLVRIWEIKFDTPPD